MEFYQTIFMILALHIVAVAIPGPDFVCVSQASIWHGKKIGILAAAGISLGLVVHISAGIFGLVALMASPTLFLIIKLLSGAYLLYLGWHGLRSKPLQITNSIPSPQYQQCFWQVVQKGFWCNVLNPKVPLYFLSVFTVMLPASTSQTQLITLALAMILVTFLWFSAVAVIFSNSLVQRQFRRMGHWLDRVVGGLFIGFGLKVLLTVQPR